MRFLLALAAATAVMGLDAAPIADPAVVAICGESEPVPVPVRDGFSASVELRRRAVRPRSSRDRMR